MRFILACLTISIVLIWLIVRHLDRLADIQWGILP